MNILSSSQLRLYLYIQIQRLYFGSCHTIHLIACGVKKISGDLDLFLESVPLRTDEKYLSFILCASALKCFPIIFPNIRLPEWSIIHASPFSSSCISIK